MIKKVQGDILLSKADAIAHGVAPLDHFDSGLAAHVREDYPSLYKDFRHYCQTYHPKPGSVWLWQGINHKKIFNLMTQEPAEHNSGHPGKASLHNLRHCLKELAHQVEQNNIQSIALPKIATGVGGLDWKDVEPRMRSAGGSMSAVIRRATCTTRPSVSTRTGRRGPTAMVSTPAPTSASQKP